MEPKEKAPVAAGKTSILRPPRIKNKRSYTEQRELDGLPEVIASLEAEQQDLQLQLSDPVFYQKEGDKVCRAKARLAELEHELSEVYARWEVLEAVGVCGVERT